MPREARTVSITGYYHIFDRGNSKQIIFEDDSDRYRFLSDIQERFVRFGVTVLAWCLMGNHFHLMVDDPHDRISNAMQCALTAYSKYFNKKTGRTGHLFDNRYFRIPVESDSQALALIDYIHLNPVKGSLGKLDSYRWSITAGRVLRLMNLVMTLLTFAMPRLCSISLAAQYVIESICRNRPRSSLLLTLCLVSGFLMRRHLF